MLCISCNDASQGLLACEVRHQAKLYVLVGTRRSYLRKCQWQVQVVHMLLGCRSVNVDGKMLYNGRPVNKRNKRQVGFVLQVPTPNKVKTFFNRRFPANT